MQNESLPSGRIKTLSPDLPLIHPNGDRLGYARFGQKLTESIFHLAPREGFVIGISGQWGSGKTTLLKFVEHYLNEVEDPPIVVHFNPWSHSGHENMTREFLLQLFRELRNSKINMDVVMGALSTLITAVSLAPQMASMKELSKSLDRLKKSNFSVSEIKKVVSSELNKHGKQIVVIVMTLIDQHQKR